MVPYVWVIGVFVRRFVGVVGLPDEVLASMGSAGVVCARVMPDLDPCHPVRCFSASPTVPWDRGDPLDRHTANPLVGVLLVPGFGSFGLPGAHQVHRALHQRRLDGPHT